MDEQGSIDAEASAGLNRLLKVEAAALREESALLRWWAESERTYSAFLRAGGNRLKIVRELTEHVQD